ncbi:hypothetical protein F5883DRAFT_366984, partial [Diaporthe sp. PMI_573]
NLFLSRVSIVLLAVGFLGVSLAPNLFFLVSALVVSVLSWGFFSFLKSLTTSLVEIHYMARLNSIIGVFNTIGLIIGSLLLATLFIIGLDLN